MDRARTKKQLNRGGERVRADLLEHDLISDASPDEIQAAADLPGLDDFFRLDTFTGLDNFWGWITWLAW